MTTAATGDRHSDSPVISAIQAQQEIDESPDRPVIIDLGKPEVYAQAHVSGAFAFAYNDLVGGMKPAAGLLPDVEVLVGKLAANGITNERRVIVYDDELGAKAARFAWTLHYLGHDNVAVIDGGLHAWINAGLNVTSRPTTPAPADAMRGFSAKVNRDRLAEFDDVLTAINDPQTRILDARTADEYTGRDVRAKHGGHIPSAVNLDWQQTIDFDNDRRLRPKSELLDMLAERGITPDLGVIVYCQTHHRSSHSYIMLRHLGFERVSGYAGSWSQWGNRDDAPIERIA